MSNIGLPRTKPDCLQSVPSGPRYYTSGTGAIASDAKGLTRPPRPETTWRQCHQLQRTENILVSFVTNKRLWKTFALVAKRNSTRGHSESIWICKYIKLIHNKSLWSRGHEFPFPTNVFIDISMIHLCHNTHQCFCKENTSMNKHLQLLPCQWTLGKVPGEAGGDGQQDTPPGSRAAPRGRRSTRRS